jgi:putative ABC transport system ATP-binding protein
MFGGASICTTNIFAAGRSAFTFPRIASMFARSESVSSPRSPSLAPVSSTNTSTGLRSNQSIRRSAPAEVSPDNPAFTTLKGKPAESIRCCSTAGHACSGSIPAPAVRLVPSIRIVRRTAAGAAELPDPRADVLCDVVVDDPPWSHATLNPQTRVPVSMLVAHDVTQTYQSGPRTLTVLDGVSFEIPAGAFVAIVGPSGSGKTTLLGLLAGLDTPSRGRVVLDGVNLNDLSEDARAKLRGEKVGFVFQNFQLIPTLSALENVSIPLDLRGDPHAMSRSRELLDRVGLADRATHLPAQLSGGEQQRVAVARAFANRPRILFADEPTGNLDGATGARIIELIEELNRESGSTVILVTHDVSLADRTDRIIRLADGRVVADTIRPARAPLAIG